MKRSFSMTLLAAFIALSFSTVATAVEDVKVKSQVTDVTLYRNQAMVTRTLSVDGENGAREVVVTDLPENISPDSLFAEGGENIEVRAVQFRTRAAGESPREEVRELQTQLQDVQQKIQLVIKKTELLQKRTTYLDKLETFSAKTATDDLNRGVLNTESLEKLTLFSFDQRNTIVEDQVKLENESRELQQEQDLLTRKLNEITNGTTRTLREAVLYVQKQGAGKQAIQLSYLVNSCGWSPSYTVRAAGDAKTAKVEYNGLIRQMSGEDWKNVNLTLSTASPALSAAGPGLAPFQVTLRAATPQPANQTMGQLGFSDPQIAGAQGKSADVKAMLSRQRDAIFANQNAISLADNFKTSWGLNGTINTFACAELVSDQPALTSMNDQMIDANQQPSFDYELKSVVTLPSRDNQQIVRILQTELPSEFYHVATPILTSYVYREAELNNDSQTDLLAGPITVYLDDRFVGRGEIPTVARGQQFIVGFGADSQLRTRRELVDKTNGINGGNRETKLTYRLVIESYKETETEIRLVDRIPTTNNKDNLRVITLPMESELSQDEVYVRIEKPKGILRWDTTVAARAVGKTAHEINYGFTLEYDRTFTVALPGNMEKQEQEFNDLQNYRINRR
ncbi:MAG: hypothetical protein ACI87E_001331 [Mariniblastus sp.]|jgi:hypothetical protein